MSDAAPTQATAGAMKERRYQAFLSYRHADNQQEGRRWASWLHETLESYEVPKKLIGKLGEHGRRIPDTLFPIFRDEAELSANADLSGTIRRALERSEYLIVICSPRAVASKYVNQEIEEFKRLGKGDRILALIIDGQPNLTTDREAPHPRESLPSALRWGKVEQDGSVDWDVPAEPICADARPEGLDEEGYTTAAAYRAALQSRTTNSPVEDRRQWRAYRERLTLAQHKIIAGLLDVSAGQLIREDNRFKLARLRRALSVVGSLLCITMLAAGWATVKQWEADRERDAANHANETANDLINEMLYSLSEKLKPLGQLPLLAQVSQSAETYFLKLPADRVDRAVEFDRAVMWLNRSHILESQGDDAKAVDANNEALAILRRLDKSSSRPDAKIRRELSMALEQYADLYEEDQSKDALTAAKEAAEISRELLKAAPDDPQLLRDAGQIWERIGDLQEDNLSNLPDALAAFEVSIRYRRTLVERHSDDARFVRDLGVALARIGDVRANLGRFADAESHYREGLSVRQKLVATHGLNLHWLSEIGRSHDSLGTAQMAQQKLIAAKQSFSDARDIRQRLAQFDPSNKRWVADAWNADSQLSNCCFQAGQLDEALQHAGNAQKLAQQFITKPDAKWKIQSIRLSTLLAEIHLCRNEPQPAKEQLQSAELLLRTMSSGGANRKLELLRAQLQVLTGRSALMQQDSSSVIEPLLSAYQTIESLHQQDLDNTELAEWTARAAGLLAQATADRPTIQPPASVWKTRCQQAFSQLAEKGLLSAQGQRWRAELVAGEVID